MSMIDGFEVVYQSCSYGTDNYCIMDYVCKGRRAGWAAIVPFYSSYVKFRIAGKRSCSGDILWLLSEL